MKTFLVELNGGTRFIITANTYHETTASGRTEYVFVLTAPDGRNILRTFQADQVIRIEPARKTHSVAPAAA